MKPSTMSTSLRRRPQAAAGGRLGTVCDETLDVVAAGAGGRRCRWPQATAAGAGGRREKLERRKWQAFCREARQRKRAGIREGAKTGIQP